MQDHVDPYRLYLHYPHPTAESKAVDPHNVDDYYGGDEAPRVNLELKRLFAAYRIELYYGQRHYAPSPTWRDELTTRSEAIPTPLRFVVRLHLFECKVDGPGRYLGFVSLRPPGSTSQNDRLGLGEAYAFRYIIDAELTVPAQMQRPRYHILTTTASSARLGVLPFRSAVYSAPGLAKDRGSTCVHLAVSQALHLIMGRFSCRPISQIEFDWHLWLTAKNHPHRNDVGTSIGEMGRRGANLREALEVIRSSCNGGGFTVAVEPREDVESGRLSREEREMTARFLMDALACGLPVVALVRTGNLIPSEVNERQLRQEAKERMNAPHAVLVLGMHLLHSDDEYYGTEQVNWDQREDRAEIPGRLIIHDTLSRGPYFEWAMSDFLSAAEDTYYTEPGSSPEESRGVHFLVVGPQELRLSHAQAWNYGLHQFLVMLRTLQDADARPDDSIMSLKEYLRVFHIPPESTRKPTDWRIVTRFLKFPEINARYVDMCQVEGSGGQPPKSCYYWVLEIRHPRASRSSAKAEITSPSGAPPALVLLWDCSAASSDESPTQWTGSAPDLIYRFNPNYPK